MRRAKIARAADDSLIKHPEVGKCFHTALPGCLSGPYLRWGQPLAILEGGTHWLGRGANLHTQVRVHMAYRRKTVDGRPQTAGWVRAGYV